MLNNSAPPNTNYTHDIGNRMLTAGSATFGYDNNGNLITKTVGGNVTSYSWDFNDMLTQGVAGGNTYVYRYDGLGNRVARIEDGAGRIFEVRTVLNGQPKTLATSISYLPFGWITGLTYGNSLTQTQGYDNQYRISSILTGSILNLTYGYDPNGNIISIVNAINPTAGPELDPPEIYSYQPGTNKLIHIETTPPIDFGYDLNANITSETGWTYIYDLSNQLIRVLSGSNVVGEYTFNGAGQRIKKVAGGTTKIFHYNLWGHLIAETNQSGQMVAEYIYLGDQLLAMIKPGEAVYYFHNDHLGTPQALTNDSGSVVWKATYAPFGQANITVGTVENNLRFPGQYYDAETGLHYNYFRYYDPTTGRYVTPDPIGLGGGINLFTYPNNPVNFADPLGLFESYWFLKWIPGQHLFDQGMTSIENSQYGWATAYFAGMVVEAGVSVYMVGTSMVARGTTTACEVGVGSTAAKNAAGKLGHLSDWIRIGPTVVSKQLIEGPGAKGAIVTTAIKGGGSNPTTGFSLPFHYHIHAYNWYKPWLWFKQTPILK